MTATLHPSSGPISLKALHDLADAPLDNAARAAKPWLPFGKRPATSGAKPEYHSEFAPAETTGEARARRDAEKDKKLGAILNYYASTDIPFERVAAHTKLDLATVIRVMKQRGREA